MGYRFGEVLQETLEKRYGELPSAAFVAREFNLRCNGDVSICDETARRWLRGSSLPSIARLAVLASWLDLDCNHAFGLDDMEPQTPPRPGSVRLQPGPDCSPLQQMLCGKIDALDEVRQRLLLGIIDAIEPQRMELPFLKKAD